MSMLQQNFHFIRGYKSRRVDFESAMAERRLDYLARWKSLERNRCLNSLREIQTSKRFNTHRTRCRFLSFRQSTSWGYNSLISPLGLSLRWSTTLYFSYSILKIAKLERKALFSKIGLLAHVINRITETNILITRECLTIMHVVTITARPTLKLPSTGCET